MGYSFDTSRYVGRLSGSPEAFHTFVDRGSLAAGVMVLDPGQEDTQEPHESDEVYYVVSGSGRLRVRGSEYEAGPGMAFFVPAGAEHRFIGSAERLVVLYFFGGRG